MNKRQRKKKEKKYLPIIVDEFNLMTMTKEEREQALKDYDKFREKYAFCKTYKQLKEGKPLHYYFPTGQQFTNYMRKLSRVARNNKT